MSNSLSDKTCCILSTAQPGHCLDHELDFGWAPLLFCASLFRPFRIALIFLTNECLSLWNTVLYELLFGNKRLRLKMCAEIALNCLRITIGHDLATPLFLCFIIVDCCFTQHSFNHHPLIWIHNQACYPQLNIFYKEFRSRIWRPFLRNLWHLMSVPLLPVPLLQPSSTSWACVQMRFVYSFPIVFLTLFRPLPWPATTNAKPAMAVLEAYGTQRPWHSAIITDFEICACENKRLELLWSRIKQFNSTMSSNFWLFHRGISSIVYNAGI